ncbi:glycosyltransferase [Lederbergia lenta]|uniref:Putative polypeptide N -acetylgalactosaminyltransferase-like protein 1 n=1 Tax=Lederbergia lenta TaxID=1467 RepID=A0A2X4WFL5_LEDLE|nr:glycosyltransferase [Lederbergia lenta]MEC2326679.1 glycosyltransferase [Lederbergia lenta]SQI61589.1 putative polypeptide N -acetylgalactosaminyltransferase-like protein 1 [Lederbergia lenta]
MKTSIIILTYNELALTKQCLNSIHKHTNVDDIELIIVDNGSTDGTVDYLKSLEKVQTIFNGKNLGFAKGCNQGVEVATGENILFLNNDTIVTKNWLQSMLKVLYKSEKVGMVGPVSNYVSGHQKIDVPYQTINEIDIFASEYCKENLEKTRQVLRLVGFCLLVKRDLIIKIGSFDERYEYGSFEDDDLCLRALQHGYELYIALDAFIHHHGHATFTGNQDIDINYLYLRNQQHFIDKWDIDLNYYMHPRYEIVQLVPMEAGKILDVGCGAGATGLELKNRQSCQLFGIELNPLAASFAKSHYQAVYEEDVEPLELALPDGYFDVILFADILEHLKDPGKVIQKYAQLLKPGGSMICSIPNILHAEALFPLLQGYWNYQNAGILDRTHLRFFTPNTVETLFPSDMFEIRTKKYNYIEVDPKVALFFNEVSHLAQKFDFSMNQLSDQIKIYQIIMHVIRKA